MSKAAMTRACGTCPFRKDSPLPIEPELLDNTVGDNLRTGYAHRCHSAEPKVCAGFARFTTERGIKNRMLAFAQTLEIFNPDTDLDRETDFELGSWEAVLQMHSDRLTQTTLQEER